MKIQVNTVEGETKKKGTKQNRVYECVESKNEGFYLTSCGRTIWNVNGDWSLIGICSSTSRRYSYTDNFIITDSVAGY